MHKTFAAVLVAVAATSVGCGSEVGGASGAGEDTRGPGNGREVDAGTTPPTGPFSGKPDAAAPTPVIDASTPPKAPDASVTPGTPDAAPPPVTPSAPLATGLSVTEVAVYQAVKVAIVSAGAKVATRNAPIVAKRAALVRVAATRGAAYRNQAITAELQISNGSGNPTILRDTKVAPATASDATLASTFNFDVPGELMVPGAQFAVALTDPAAAAGSADNGSARYPAGTAKDDLGAVAAGDQLKVVLVPIRYDADGSARMPDISAAQVARYRDALYGMYPVARVDVTVHAAYPFAPTISSNGNGFDDALNAMIQLRARERPTKDVYYYGIFSPTTSFSTFCRGGCVTGLSGLGTSPNDANVRASVGVGFAGAESASTAAHEIGHAHGRPHAPCGGPAGPDPRYPYAGGTLGVWGYDLVAKRLMNPTSSKDFMGYCNPPWVSDYNYRLLFDRVKFVNGASTFSAWATPQAYRMIRVAGDGSLSWRESIDLDAPPSAEPRDVTFTDDAGRVVSTAEGQFYAYDHLPGGYILVPDTTRTFARAQVTGMGEVQ